MTTKKQKQYAIQPADQPAAREPVGGYWSDWLDQEPTTIWTTDSPDGLVCAVTAHRFTHIPHWMGLPEDDDAAAVYFDPADVYGVRYHVVGVPGATYFHTREEAITARLAALGVEAHRIDMLICALLDMRAETSQH